MSTTPSTPWQSAKSDRLAKQLLRLSWIGFRMQLALLAISFLLLIYVLFLASPESTQRKGIGLSNKISYSSLLVMALTTFWFFRYTRLGQQLGDPELRPRQSSVLRTLWIGLWVSCLGNFFIPATADECGGTAVIYPLGQSANQHHGRPGQGGDPAYSLSAIDVVSLTSLLIILTAELIVMGFTLWLLFRVS